MGKYITKQRKVLLEFFYNHQHETFSTAELAESLKSQKISISAIYRNLSELELENKVRRHYKTGSKEIYYQYIDEENCENSLHLSCVKCEQTFHMELENEKNIVNQILNIDGFEIDKIKTVLYGICEDCKVN